MKASITVGIPAHNEAENILHVLNDILEQETKNIELKEIIVVSDGSTDNTEKIIKNIKDRRIKLIVYAKRKGMATGENEILRLAKSDIVILLNADIRIQDRYFLEAISKPILNNTADLVSCRTIETKPTNFFGKILNVSMKVKIKLYETFQDGNNVYTCHGQARAFSKKFYTHFSFPYSVGEDAYSYIYCISNGYTFVYTRETNIIYQLPLNYHDHRKQSVRFLDSKKLLKRDFGEKLIDKEYNIPLSLYIKHLGASIFSTPIELSLFIIMFTYLFCTSWFRTNSDETWSMVKSSKRIIL